MEQLKSIPPQKKYDWAELEKQGVKLQTKGGKKVMDVHPYKPTSLMERIAYGDKNIFQGYLEGAEFPYAIWDETGKALYVHNFRKEDLSDYDLGMPAKSDVLT